MSEQEGMSLIVKTITRWLKAFMLLFGIYQVLYGHIGQGGGFSGGVVIACTFVLITLAEGQKVGMKIVSKMTAMTLVGLGALIFLGTGVAGMITKGAFLANLGTTSPSEFFTLRSGGSIELCKIGIGLQVGMILFMVFTIFAAVRVTVTNGRRRMVQRGRKTK